MVKVAIAGATGYTGGELVRLLINHPQVDLRWLFSTSLAGESVSRIHRDLCGESNLRFSDNIGEPDILFLALGHGLSREFLNRWLSDKCRVIDLGNDFRIDSEYGNEKFVYGLSELFADNISKARLVANPGCFATAVELALAPLAKERLLRNEIHIHAITGSTGAGRSLSHTSHFSYRAGNVSIYKPFIHQHLAEIEMSLESISGLRMPAINMIPVRGDFTRGILASIYTEIDEKQTVDQIRGLFSDLYSDSPFVHISDEVLSLKEVVNTNKALLHIERHGKYVYITSIIDNLLKGASGQAVQNMNIMFGFPQDLALKLKGTAF